MEVRAFTRPGRSPKDFVRVGRRAGRLLLVGLAVVSLRMAQIRAVSAAGAPAPVRQETFGSSVRGRPLVAYVLGDGPNTTVIFGGFHGNEPASPVVVDDLRRNLIQHPEELTGCQVVLAPRVNPDGLEARTRVNANRVDLNRNFPVEWLPASRGRRFGPGPFPESEPETRAVAALLHRFRPSRVVSIHQPFRCMAWSGPAGEALAELMRRYNGYRTTGDIGYPTPGSFGAYCRSLGIAEVTLELGHETGKAAWRENGRALLAAIRV